MVVRPPLAKFHEGPEARTLAGSTPMPSSLRKVELFVPTFFAANLRGSFMHEVDEMQDVFENM